MKKLLLRYLVNTILFIVLWGIQATIVIGFSFAEVGARPSAPIAIGGIVAIIISYRLVKRINKSNLWSRLFDETEDINEVVEEKKVEVEDSNSDKQFKKGMDKLVKKTFIILAIIIPLSFLGVYINDYFKEQNIKDDKTEINLDEQLEKLRANINLIKKQKVFNTTGYLTRAKHFQKLAVAASIGCDVLALDIRSWKHPTLNRDGEAFNSITGNICDKASVLYADAAINAVNNAINLDPSNSYLYYARSRYYWNKAALNCYHKSQERVDNYRFMVLDLETAISLYPNGRPVGSQRNYFSDIKNNLSKFYWLMGMAKMQGLNLYNEACRDYKTACNLGDKTACEDYNNCK